MSGEGMVAADLSLDVFNLVPPAVEAAVIDTIVAERAGVLKYARETCAAIDRMIAMGKVPAGEAALLKARVREFGDGIAIGLHRDGVEDARVRTALRALVEAGA